MNNIAFGIHGEKIDRKVVEYAARISNLHDFIISELPNGYQTIVGERGIRLNCICNSQLVSHIASRFSIGGFGDWPIGRLKYFVQNIFDSFHSNII